MMERELNCPGVEAELTAYSQGELSSAMRSEVEGHLAACASCRSLYEEIQGVFTIAGEIEDIAPSMRFKRNVEHLLARERQTAAERVGLVFRLSSTLAFLLHRARISPRFRLATISVGAHAVLLLLVSFYVLPRMVDPVVPVVMIDPDLGFTPVDNPVRPEVARGNDNTALELPSELPLLDERFVQTSPSAPLSSTIPMQPPAHPVVYPRFSGLFTSGILTTSIKERRLASLSLDRDGTLDALDRSLKWLAAHQEEDGSWASSERNPTYRMGVTSTALMAFLADGHSQTRGTAAFRQVVTKGIRYLLLAQKQKGPLKGLIGSAKGHYSYNHAIATLALVEAWSIDRRRMSSADSHKLRIAIGDAVAFIVKIQTPDGGWRYQAPIEGAAYDNDTSVSVFQIMALAAARRAGFDAPGEAFEGFTSWLKRVTGKSGIVGYQRRGDRDAGPRTLTAGALFLEELLGIAAPLRDRQAKLVLADLEDADGPAANDALLRFYSAHAFRLRGRNVLELFSPTLLRSQNGDGSWSSATDRHAVHAGDAFLTALNALTLTAAYRFAG